MLCPYCQSDKTKVVDTRKFDTLVMRVRVCDVCNNSFQTEELLHKVKPAKITPNSDKISK